METTDLSTAKNIRMLSETIGVAQYGDDRGLIVKFSTEPHLDSIASTEAGRPIYKDRPYITINFPGDKTRQIKRPVRTKMGRNGEPPDALRFPRQWAAYQSNQQDVHDGTPLSEWGPMSKTEALNYKAANVHTVEELSGVADAVLGNLGTGARTMRDKAIAWLKATKDPAAAMALAAQNESLRNDVESLKQQLAELGAQKRGPGRPRKDAEQTED